MLQHQTGPDDSPSGPVADMGNRTCGIKTCPDAAYCRGWCSKHYQMWLKHGDPLAKGKPGRPPGRSTCSIEGCGKQVAGLGWCRRHYEMYRRHGDPEWVAEPGALRKYALDDTFFDVIDTEAKAYWLGFITADGCVQAGAVGTAGWQRHQVSVKLKASDAGHLEKLKADLAAENPIYFDPQATKGHPAAGISFSSQRLVGSLIRLGVTPRKSLTLMPWSGPPDLMRHYWRGVFDGDGTLVKHPRLERDKWHLRLLGSEATIEAFRLWSVGICGTTARKYPKGNIWSFTMGGLASPQAVARELYGGATVYLDRKHELALRLMAAPIRHRSPAKAPAA